MDLWFLENEYAAQGYRFICGVDEAGRGPLAGPVFAAAVILPVDVVLPGLNDSKKLTEPKRNMLFEMIISKAQAYSIASASHTEIDDINILQATYLAMNRAIEMILPKIDESSFLALIDGNGNKGINYNSVCVVGGDGKSASIAAASILAKVSRDRHMVEMSKIYPDYGFEKHKGYGSKQHRDVIVERGPCEIHRVSFLRNILHNGVRV